MQERTTIIVERLNAIQPKPKRLLVQMPAGLKQRSFELMEALEQKGYKAVLSADDCFGACDLPLTAAKAVKADAILHIGHAPFYKPIKTEIPVVYYEWPISIEIDVAGLQKEIAKVKEKHIGLVSSVQYIHMLPKIAEIMRKNGKTIEIGSSVLGCRAKAADELADNVDALVFVGSGMFHPLGLNLGAQYFMDLERNEIRDIRKDVAKWEKIRWARISKAKDARSFAIIVSTKPGQSDMEQAENVKAALESRHKKAFIVVMDRVTDEALQGIKADAFINTACPRLADDKWSKPFVNASDIGKILE
jgi:2-(3-amino-3-carboxypropyl)histidine synthase